MPNHSKWFNLWNHSQQISAFSFQASSAFMGFCLCFGSTGNPPPVILMKDCKIASTFRIETICCKFIFTLNCAPLGREERQPSHRRVDGSGTAQQPNKFFSFFFLLSVLHSARENVIKNLGFKCWIIFSLKWGVFCTLKRYREVYSWSGILTKIAQLSSKALQLFSPMASFSITWTPFWLSPRNLHKRDRTRCYPILLFKMPVSPTQSDTKRDKAWQASTFTAG